MLPVLLSNTPYEQSLRFTNEHVPSSHPAPHLPLFPAAAALLVVRLPVAGATGAFSGSVVGGSARGARLRFAAGFELLLGASGWGKAGSSRDGALRLREVLKDIGGLGTTIGDAGFKFELVCVVEVVCEVVAFDLPRVVGVLWFGVAVLAGVVFDLVFGVAVGPVV